MSASNHATQLSNFVSLLYVSSTHVAWRLKLCNRLDQMIYNIFSGMEKWLSWIIPNVH